MHAWLLAQAASMDEGVFWNCLPTSLEPGEYADLGRPLALLELDEIVWKLAADCPRADRLLCDALKVQANRPEVARQTIQLLVDRPPDRLGLAMNRAGLFAVEALRSLATPLLEALPEEFWLARATAHLHLADEKATAGDLEAARDILLQIEPVFQAQSVDHWRSLAVTYHCLGLEADTKRLLAILPQDTGDEH